MNSFWKFLKTFEMRSVCKSWGDFIWNILEDMRWKIKINSFWKSMKHLKWEVFGKIEISSSEIFWKSWGDFIWNILDVKIWTKLFQTISWKVEVNSFWKFLKELKRTFGWSVSLRSRYGRDPYTRVFGSRIFNYMCEVMGLDGWTKKA